MIKRPTQFIPIVDPGVGAQPKIEVGVPLRLRLPLCFWRGPQGGVEHGAWPRDEAGSPMRPSPGYLIGDCRNPLRNCRSVEVEEYGEAAHGGLMIKTQEV